MGNILDLTGIEEQLECEINIPYPEFLLGFNYALLILTPRESECVRKMYFENKTSNEISKEYGVTKNRIRQIIQKGMFKIKRWNKRKHILDKGIEWYVMNEVNKAIEETEQKYKIEHSPMSVRIEKLDLTTRSYNCLKRAKINTLDDLSKLTAIDLYKIRNMGRKSLYEIIEKLKKYDIVLDGTEEMEAKKIDINTNS